MGPSWRRRWRRRQRWLVQWTVIFHRNCWWCQAMSSCDTTLHLTEHFTWWIKCYANSQSSPLTIVNTYATATTSNVVASTVTSLSLQCPLLHEYQLYESKYQIVLLNLGLPTRVQICVINVTFNILSMKLLPWSHWSVIFISVSFCLKIKISA